MKFIVKPENEEQFELNEKTLFDLLSKEIMKKERDDFLYMSNILMDYLKITNSFNNVSIGQISTLAFSLGYFYRIFLEKNDVEIVNDEKNEPDIKNNEIGPSEISS